MKIKALASSAFAAFLIAAGTYDSYAQTIVHNDVPRTISYQGVLADNSGNKLPDGNYRITLSLYADPAGSLKVWQDTYDAHVSGGIFNLYLGAGNNRLPDLAAMNTALWIGTQVGDAPQMYPLTPLSASPYALNVPDRAITTGKLADGAVTADKVDMPYIAGVQINDREIAGTGTVLKLKGSDAIRLDYDETTNSVTIGAGNAAERGTSGDGEKGAAVQDATFGTNWIGYTLGGTFGVPLGSYNTIAGGSSHTIYTGSDYSTIGGGWQHQVTSDYSFIGGGSQHQVTGDYSFIGGGQVNAATGDYSVIGGGASHDISDYGSYNTIGGGYDNLIYSLSASATEYSGIGSGIGNQINENSDHSVIAGGSSNTIEDNTSGGFIGGGLANILWPAASYSGIAGGQANTIYGGSAHGTIGGGQTNTIGNISTPVGDWATISGGRENTILADYATIGGGYDNSVSGNNSFIGGGGGNSTASGYSVIGGGANNTVVAYGNYNTIGGGRDNQIFSSSASATENSGIGSGIGNMIGANTDYSVIAGGNSNIISDNSLGGFIGGGSENQIWVAASESGISAGQANSIYGGSAYGTIGGGQYNEIGDFDTPIADWAAISGGRGNEVKADYGFIGGGLQNAVTGEASAIAGGSDNNISGVDAFIGGGYSNLISGHSGAMGGGGNNKITNDYGALGGGLDNVVSGRGAVIGGGEKNLASANYAAVGGGYRNQAVGHFSTIGGGIINWAANDNATIGGGYGNFAAGLSSTIPGGDSLQTPSYAQTAIGFYNAPRGFVPAQPATKTARTAINAPLFMVGNGVPNLIGTGVTRSNAFEVSYNGHSVVYDVNGTSNNMAIGRRVPFSGATYVDNILYAWGEVDAAGNVNADFGVASVFRVAAGTYIVRIDLQSPAGASILLNSASITATIVEKEGEPENACRIISSTKIAGNQFTIRTRDLSCKLVDTPFMFKVSGRP